MTADLQLNNPTCDGHRPPLQQYKMPERLHRLERHFDRNPIWFVTACTHERAKILARPEVNLAVQQFAGAGASRGAWLGAYVLMPDHLHAFVALDDREINLSDWIKSLKNTISKTLRTLGVESPHWQKGFFDHVLRSQESYSQKWDYMRNNPVRAGSVKCAEAWPYHAQPHPLEFRESL